MASAGDGEAPKLTDGETLAASGWARRQVARTVRAADGGRDGGHLVRVVPGVTRADRPPWPSSA